MRAAGPPDDAGLCSNVALLGAPPGHAALGGAVPGDNATALVDPLPRPLDNPPLGDGLPLSDVTALVGAPPGCAALLGAVPRSCPIPDGGTLENAVPGPPNCCLTAAGVGRGAVGGGGGGVVPGGHGVSCLLGGAALVGPVVGVDGGALVGAPLGSAALLGAVVGVGGSGCLRAAVGDHLRKGVDGNLPSRTSPAPARAVLGDAAPDGAGLRAVGGERILASSGWSAAHCLTASSLLTLRPPLRTTMEPSPTPDLADFRVDIGASAQARC